MSVLFHTLLALNAVGPELMSCVSVASYRARSCIPSSARVLDLNYCFLRRTVGRGMPGTQIVFVPSALIVSVLLHGGMNLGSPDHSSGGRPTHY